MKSGERSINIMVVVLMIAVTAAAVPVLASGRHGPASKGVGVVRSRQAGRLAPIPFLPRPSAPTSGIGTIKEFTIPTADSAPSLITPGPDGNMWFSEYGAVSSSKVARITPSGAITEFTLPTAYASPAGIVAGPDGNLWVGEAATDKIARVTTSGVITEFSIPSGNRPYYVTPGPDGNLWFTEFSGNNVGKITTTGTVTEYAVPTVNSGPVGITAGPDGNLWFTEFSGNKVARITTSGVITEYPVPQFTGVNVDPWGITAGPDGNLWFGTAAYNDNVFEITTSGVISAPIYTPHDDSFSTTVSTGLDGDIWFSEETGMVGRSPTNGVGAEDATIPTPASDPWGVSAGPDGNMWLSEYGGFHGDKIARVSQAVAGTANVLSLASGFCPGARSLVAQGTSVQWSFFGPNAATATDTTGMGLFDSGSKTLVSYYTFVFTAAGAYSYDDSLNPSHTGTVVVPISVPSSGTVSTPFPVTWASAAPPVNFVFDVQVRTPGSSTWSNWQTGVTSLTAMYTPTQTGTYQFRARLRNSVLNKASGFSPPGKVVVS